METAILAERTASPDTGEIHIGALRISRPADQLFAALAAAQQELRDPLKENTAQVQTRGGGAFSYSYADLATALRDSRPILAAQGLAVTQWPAVPHEGRVELTTLIVHASGQWMCGHIAAPIPGTDRMNPLQTLGSVISYLRRYAYLAALGLAADDDDGSAGRAQTQRRRSSGLAEPSESPTTVQPAGQAAVGDQTQRAAPRLITGAAHRRLEGLLRQAGLDRERVKTWLSRRHPDVYPTPGDVHLDRILVEHAGQIEEQIPRFQAAMNKQVAGPKRESFSQQVRDEALKQAQDDFGWTGDFARLSEIAGQLEDRARIARKAAEMKDGHIDQREVDEAQRLAERARALRQLAAGVSEEVKP